MPKIIVAAGIDDRVRWEAGFRTHGELFGRYVLSAPISYGFAGDTQVAVVFETDDMDAFMAAMQSEETAAAMEYDGVQRDTVRMYVLDAEYDPSS